MKDLGSYYIKKYERAKAERSNWESLWQETADYVVPQNNDIHNARIPGERKTNRIYDSTGIQSNKLLASALHSMLTNPTSQWFGLGTGERDIDGDHSAQLWYEDSVDKMFSVLNSSNFQPQIHETYLALGNSGTTTLFIGEHPEDIVYFKSDQIYDYVISEDRFGRVSEISWSEEFSYAQLVDEYGEDAIDENTHREGQSDPKQARRFEVIITIEPNKNYCKDEPKVNTNKPIRTVHVIRKSMHVCRESGYNEMPFAVPRWNKFAGEKYGRSPGMECLPDNKMVNAMMKVNIRGAQKVVDPPLIVPDHGFALPLDTRPGGTIYKRQGIQDRIEPLTTGARPDIGEQMMESARLRIRQAFFIDQLQLVQQNNMTATEVVQRTEENLRLMGPILGRLNDELLKPIVDRVFSIMLRRKMFKPAPEILKDKDIRPKYISQIAKAQRAPELDTINRVIGAMMPILEYQPQVMDNFDGDETLRFLGDIAGLPNLIMRSPKDVGKIRQDIKQAQQEQEEVALQNQEADTMQKLASAQPQQ